MLTCKKCSPADKDSEHACAGCSIQTSISTQLCEACSIVSNECRVCRKALKSAFPESICNKVEDLQESLKDSLEKINAANRSSDLEVKRLHKIFEKRIQHILRTAASEQRLAREISRIERRHIKLTQQLTDAEPAPDVVISEQAPPSQSFTIEFEDLFCRKCLRQGGIFLPGQCEECENSTSSNAYKLCKTCSVCFDECCDCRATLGRTRPPGLVAVFHSETAVKARHDYKKNRKLSEKGRAAAFAKLQEVTNPALARKNEAENALRQKFTEESAPLKVEYDTKWQRINDLELAGNLTEEDSADWYAYHDSYHEQMKSRMEAFHASVNELMEVYKQETAAATAAFEQAKDKLEKQYGPAIEQALETLAAILAPYTSALQFVYD